MIFLLRKKFTARQFRYLFGAYVLAPIPWLRHRYSAYARSATLPEFESNVVAQEEVRATLDLSDMGEDYLTWYRSTPDLPAMHDNRIELRLDFMAKVLDDCELLPRSPAILHRPSERIVLCPGRKAERNIVRPVRYRATEHVSGLSISMAGVHHYYHFFFDQMLLVLQTLDALPQARKATILANERMLPFQKAAYDILREQFPLLHFHPVAADVKVRCEQMIAACHVRDKHMINWFAPAHLLQHMGQMFREHYAVTPKKPERLVLISRRHQKLRRLINEDELYALLSPLGFELVAPERLSHAEQVELFAHARIVIGSSGAALTNLLFCQPGTTAIELCPSTFYKPFWVGLSKQLGLDHHVITTNQVMLYDNFRITPERVLEVVKQVIATH